MTSTGGIVVLFGLFQHDEEPECLSPCIRLFWRGGELDLEECEVFLEKKLLCTASDSREAVAAAFGAFYAFNLKYPSGTSNTLLFLDVHVLGIEKTAKLPIIVQRKINLLHV